MAIVKTTKDAIKGAKKVYRRTANLTRNTVNRVMRPVTKVTKRVVKRVPVIGGPLGVLAGLPRTITRGGTSVMIALPSAAGRIVDTGSQVIMRSIDDPLLATGLTGRPMRRMKTKKSTKRKPKK